MGSIVYFMECSKKKSQKEERPTVQATPPPPPPPLSLTTVSATVVYVKSVRDKIRQDNFIYTRYFYQLIYLIIYSSIFM